LDIWDFIENTTCERHNFKWGNSLLTGGILLFVFAIAFLDMSLPGHPFDYLNVIPYGTCSECLGCRPGSIRPV
jgi:hypothetical protein